MADKRESFIDRIRPHAEWEGIRWGWEIGRSALIPLLLAGSSWLRHVRIDWVGLGILFALCLLIGYLILPRKRAKFRNTDIDAALNDLLEKCDETRQEAREAGGQSRLLLHFYDQAVLLEKILVSMWHHWDTAGQKLMYPIGGKIEWKDWNTDTCMGLSNELRDFKVQYSSHVSWVKVVFPGLISQLIENGYPSDKEYPDVLSDLRAHAELLNNTAKTIWDSENPVQSLNIKQQ